MKIFTEKNKLTRELENTKKNIGFIPTMGMLHRGHLSLIEKSTQENEITVVSIFVNPTQFNDPKDLKKYPRNLEKDIKKLQAAKCTHLFIPSTQEIYPKPDTRTFNFGYLNTVMEAKYRKNHFNGVAQAVSKLFEIVPAHKAYFGLKDLQQYTIIKQLAQQLKLRTQIIPCPTVRDTDKLALSSRNKRLTPQQRKNAQAIPNTLFKARKLANTHTPEQLTQWAIQQINQNPNIQLHYFQIVDPNTLKTITHWNETPNPTACIAANIGETRLIDNLIF